MKCEQKMYLEACQVMYPEAYMEAAFDLTAKMFPFLPVMITERIHQYRKLEDVVLPLSLISKILGFGKSRELDDILQYFFIHQQTPEKIPWYEHKDVVYLMLYTVSAEDGYQLLPVQYLSDAKAMEIAMYKDPRWISYMHSHLRTNPKIIILAQRQNFTSHIALRILTTHAELRKNRDIALAAVKQHGENLHRFDNSFFHDPEIAMEAVKECGVMLRHIAERFRGDKKYIFAALGSPMSGYGGAFRWASTAAKNDRSIVAAAIRKSSISWRYRGETLTNDRSLAMLAFRKAGGMLWAAPTWMKDDLPVVMIAVKSCGTAFLSASARLQANETVIRCAIMKNAQMMEFANETLKNDKKLVMHVLKRNKSMKQYISEALKVDNDIIRILARKRRRAL